MTPGESTIRRQRSSSTDRDSSACPGAAAASTFNTTTHLGPFERAEQTAFADVVEANNAGDDALRRAALGLYAMRRRSNVGAVPDAGFKFIR